MAALIYLDTHVLVWLYAGKKELFPPDIRTLLELNDLLISPFVTLELQYLFEIGRTSKPATELIRDLSWRMGIKVCDLSFPQIVEASLLQSWTRDPFDRIIVGHAQAASKPLLTKDKTILKHFPGAIWSVKS